MNSCNRDPVRDALPGNPPLSSTCLDILKYASLGLGNVLMVNLTAFWVN